VSLNKEFGEALKAEGLTQKEFADSLGEDQSTLSKIIRGARKLPKEKATKFVEALDNLKFTFAAKREVSRGASAPFLDGNRVIRSVAAMRLMIDKEDEDLQEFWNHPFWFINPEYLTDMEREEAKRFAQTYLFKVILEENMIAVFCEQMGFSYKDLYKQQNVKAKSRGLVK
jgi:transcriptional regulator with XRE-family HTH domain